MEKVYKEKFSNIVIRIVKPIINILLRKEIKVIATGEKITRDRDPFILVSNHFNTWDSFIVMQNIDYNIRFVSTEMAFLDKGKKFSMGVLARVIPKRVGKVDVVATRKILNYLENGYAIGLFPEGDNTFYGETLGIFKSTGKLIKKAGVDVVLVKQLGGYISQPRWADNFAKNGIVYTNNETLITKEELKELSPTMINDKIAKAIYNNDYEFQKEKMIKFDRNARAEGIERLLYYCPNCNSSMTVYGQGDDIYCSKCGKIGHINEYEFIEDGKFDNLVSWNKYQYEHIEEVINSEFMFEVTLNLVNTISYKSKKLGKYKVKYKDKILFFSNEKSSYEFEISKIKYAVNTMRNSLSFDYGEDTFNLSDIRHQFVIFEMCRFLNGDYKE